MKVDGVGNIYGYPLNPSQIKKSVDRNSDLYKACLDFESLFIKQMLDEMRKTVQKDGLLDGGMSEDIFEDMLYDEYAKKMAETAQFGLAETIYNQLSSKA
jgi:flagellar protein FlgJ